MAKLAFTKLGLKVNQDIKIVSYNDQDIEVKQYISIEDKLQLIANVINMAADQNNFANPVKLDVFTVLEIMYAYTNLSFTEKQKEDAVKLYDLLISNGVYSAVIREIPASEIRQLTDGIKECAAAIYTYRNSVLGLLETISQDYSNLNLDAAAIQEKLANGENVEFLKDVLTKLG